MNVQSTEDRVVLNGYGPSVRIKVPATSKVTVLTNTGAKTVTVKDSVTVNYAA